MFVFRSKISHPVLDDEKLYFETSKLPIVIVPWSTLTESFTNLVDLVSI